MLRKAKRFRVIPPSNNGGTMKLLIQRSQKGGLMGGVKFTLSANVRLDDAKRGYVSKYKMNDIVLYEKDDNAACEGFFGRLKTELFYPRSWQCASIEQFIYAVDSYIRWYNQSRIKISIGALSPVEYRRSLGISA